MFSAVLRKSIFRFFKKAIPKEKLFSAGLNWRKDTQVEFQNEGETTRSWEQGKGGEEISQSKSKELHNTW